MDEPTILNLDHIHFASEDATIIEFFQTAQGGKIMPDKELNANVRPRSGPTVDRVKDHMHGIVSLDRKNGWISLKPFTIGSDKPSGFRIGGLKEQGVAE